MTRPAALAPFQSRAFRFQWPADLCTAWALEMETLILGWYILVETGSVLWLAVFGSLQFVGTLLAPMIGMLADRHGTRNVLTFMRFGYAACAALICFLALTGQLTPMVALALTALSGLIRPSDIGIRTALCSLTVPAAHIVAAMSISRTTQDTARIAGALAGAGFIASFGIGTAYTVIASIYLVGALLTMMVPAVQQLRSSSQTADGGRGAASAFRDLKEGLALVIRTPALLACMSLGALVNLTAFPFTGGLMPYIARDVFHLDQSGLGLLVASFAFGALIGSVTLSAIGKRIRPARTMLAASIIWYLALMAFVLATDLGVAIAMLVIAGVAQSMSMVSLVILLLRIADERFRGRVIGVRMLVIYTLPLGLLIAGALIPAIGFRATGIIFLVTGLLLTLEIAVGWRDDLLRRDSLANAR